MDWSADLLAEKLSFWFPWAKWECRKVGAYACVWATTGPYEGRMGEFNVRGECTERVARCRSWENARDAAKAWAWKQPEMKAHAK